MKNQYVGDIGDFGKYGLLKNLCRDLKLGVVWYLTPNDKKKKTDGKFIKYLNLDSEKYKPGEKERNERRFQQCDSDLYDKLHKIVDNNKRDVKEIAQREVLPSDTKYYDSIINRVNRQGWFAETVEAVRNCEIVFLDPDNGFTKTQLTSPKHVQLDEVKKFFKRGQSLIVYHHLGMHKKGEEQISYWREEIEKTLQGRVDGKIIILWYHRGTARAYFIIPKTKKHYQRLNDAVDRLIRSPWGQGKKPHFTLLKVSDKG